MFIVFGRGERLGSGADVIRQGWRENGWPDPEIKEHFGPNTDRVELTLKLNAYTENYTENYTEKTVKVSEKTSEKIKKMMRTNPTVTIKEIADTLGRKQRTIEIAISKLKTSGDIIRDGSDKDGTWKVLK